MLISDLIENAHRQLNARGKHPFARESWRIWMQHLYRIMGDMPADQLTTRHQEQYRARRRQEAAEESTINRELQILRRAYKLGLIHEPPLVSRVPNFVMARINNARKVFIDLGTLNRLREEAGKHSLWMRAAVEMAYTYGWRRGELVSLRVGDVDLFDDTVRLQTSKNGEPREAPIPKALRPYLEPLCKDRAPEASLFGQTVGSFSYQWRAVRKAAGAEKRVIFHDFRRTSAKAKRAAGVSESVIMELQGWKTSNMFRRYAITSREDKLDAFRKQEAWEASRKQAASV